MVLPKSIRAAHRWRPGTEFTVEETRRRHSAQTEVASHDPQLG
ncbi:MAG: AbrB/MazE/SpoVT family DNA-binding domain-containing protein [Deltaproteobacteria bacterium]|nr:AbrB/MazE/SpoVT family DNA-binding domain-containing protein [Deltaproteobacteria bacterium]